VPIDPAALGVGAGADDPEDELAFTTENSDGVVQEVLPTMAVVLVAGGGVWKRVGSFDPAMLVHGEQAIELHRPLPVEGVARSTTRIAAIHDKGSGAVVVTETEAVDAATGEPLFTNRSSAFIRGEGGFGGDRGPSGARLVPEDREPDEVVRYVTRRDQALLYRLSGDRNPLHSDPAFARRAGFDRPILHGLCTYGFTGRALLHSVCGGDPSRFRSMEGRFSSPVWPGDTLTVSVWRTGDGEAAFRTARDDGTVVLDQGRCTFST
jgi:acyl dehydratase